MSTKENNKLDPVGSTVRYEMMKLCTGSVGLLAYSHHDRFPPGWGFVRDDNGGNLSGESHH